MAKPFKTLTDKMPPERKARAEARAGRMLLNVRNAEALNGYRLALDFSDGTSGIADLSEHITRKPFLGLQDDRVFRHAVVEHGAVDWPDGDVGIATEALYALVHGQPKPETGS